MKWSDVVVGASNEAIRVRQEMEAMFREELSIETLARKETIINVNDAALTTVITSTETKAYEKISWRASAVYRDLLLIAYLDRVNVGFASCKCCRI